MKLTEAIAGVLLLWGATEAGATPHVTLAPQQPAPGEVFRVMVGGVEDMDGLWATLGGRDFTLWQSSETTWEGLAAVDRDHTSGETTLKLRGRKNGDQLPVAAVSVRVASREYPEQHLTVKKGMVNLSPEDQERAVRENRLIRKVLDRTTVERLWQVPFTMPLNGPVTSTFGVRRIYNGTPKSYHSGLDIAAPRGTSVVSSGAGRVALVGDYFYTGKTVLVDHGLGLYTAYFHLDAVTVTEGAALATGGELGQVGSTGRSTGPHLHWGVYLSGQKADPLSLLHAFGASGGGESP